jgi:hypothetical protein
VLLFLCVNPRAETELDIAGKTDIIRARLKVPALQRPMEK